MSYTAQSISVLKGLEPVRHRPGMYTRTDNPLHIMQEAIDNAADEALGGYCKRIQAHCEDDIVRLRRKAPSQCSARTT